MKECVNCKQLLELAMFHKDKQSKDGHVRRCKKCVAAHDSQKYEKNKDAQKAYSKKRYAENSESIKQKARNKYPTIIEQEKKRRRIYREKNPDKSHEHYEKNKDAILNRHRRYNAENKDVIAAQKRIYYENNKEEMSAKHRAYAKQNYESARTRSHKYRTKKRASVTDLTVEQWKFSLAYFEEKCCYCGKIAMVLNQEHIIPVSKGGNYTASNIIPACGSCNSRKHNKNLLAWYSKMDFFSWDRLSKISSYLDLFINDKENKHE